MKTCKQLFPYALKVSTLVVSLLAIFPADAMDWFVSSTADANVAGTLRFAVLNAAPNDHIYFTGTLGGQTIALTLGELLINKNLTITGIGPDNLSIVNLNGRVFHVKGGGPINVVISGLHLTGIVIGTNGADGIFGAVNGLNGEDVNGGCILNEPSEILSVSNCFFEGCQAVGGNGGHGYTNDTYGTPAKGGDGGLACGGAICNDGGDLILQSCAFSSNSVTSGSGGNGYFGGNGGNGGAAEGGALCDTYGNMDMYVVDCTFYTNAAVGGYAGDAGDAWIHHPGPANGGNGGNGGPASGGGVFIDNACPMPGCTGLIHNTICQNEILPGGAKPGGAPINGGAPGTAGNNGSANGGGFFHHNLQGIVPIDNTIIARNFATFRFTGGAISYNGPDVCGDVESLFYNLVGVLDPSSSGWIAGFDLIGSTTAPIDPVLGPFQNNGGETPTMAPLSCSPAIDAGSTGTVTADQIGQPRPTGITTPPYISDGSDIGAFELQSYPPGLPVQMSIAQSGSNVIISWPSSSCYIVQQTGDLAMPNWVNTPGPINIVGNQKEVVVAMSSNAQFFRLFHP